MNTIHIFQFTEPEGGIFDQDWMTDKDGNTHEIAPMFDRTILEEVEANQKALDNQKRDIERRIFDLHNDIDCMGNCFSDADPGL